MTVDEPPDVRLLPWTHFDCGDDSGYELRIQVTWRGQEWHDAVVVRDDELSENLGLDGLRALIEARIECALLSLADVMGYRKVPLGCLLPVMQSSAKKENR